MRFEILRASSHGADSPIPCAGAFKEEGAWFINIDTLEQLCALRDEVGDDLILSDDCIWIYDGYME